MKKNLFATTKKQHAFSGLFNLMEAFFKQKIT